jgi:4-amino-4-deoxy-L-arabinose transferase-like glycosyltransferase
MSKYLTLPAGLVILMMAAAGGFMFNAATGDSAIFDETAHIVAGYTYVRHLDYRFNPEHPPLVKMLSGLPLAFLDLNFSTEKGYWDGLNEQWWAGNEFLYKSGNDADQIIFWARLGPILLSLILLAFVYFWSRELVGRWWALLPTVLLAFSPIFLTHGHYVTTDVGAALSMLVSIYFFLKMLADYSNKNLLYAGLAFGFAQAVKFSAVLLIPFYFLIAIIFYFVNRPYQQEAEIVEILNNRPWYRYLWQTVLVMAIGYLLVVYPLYLAATWNYPVEKQVLDTQMTIQNFRVKPLADLNIWMAGNKILRPFGEYLLGLLMVLQRSAGGNNAFFLGMLSSGGWWYYFPVAYLMKEPLPILLILLIAFKIGLWNMGTALNISIGKVSQKFREYLEIHFAEFALAFFAALYWLSSIISPLNIGVRHILPTIPVFYMLAAGALRKWFAARPIPIALTLREKIENYLHTIVNFWAKTALLSLLVVWLIIETSLAAPHFLSYFNNLSGWRENGFYYITDSNFDWGQDLKRFKDWVDENIDPADKIAVDYFGGGDPAYYLGAQFEPWWSARGNPEEEGIEWLAISANTIQGALATPIRGFYRNPADEYRWLENPYQFTDRAGTSIFIYKL